MTILTPEGIKDKVRIIIISNTCNLFAISDPLLRVSGKTGFGFSHFGFSSLDLANTQTRKTNNESG
jgi:hypothetical protein